MANSCVATVESFLVTLWACSINPCAKTLNLLIGTIHKYSLPRLALENKHLLSCKPYVMALNSNSVK